MPEPTFGELCEEHYERVARTAYLITGDRQEALDLAQETFARAYEHWRSVSAMSNPEGWLYRVVTNLAISSRRRVNRRVPRQTIAAPATMPEPLDPELTGAMRSLTPAQRAAVVCRFYLDMSVEEAARVLDKKPGTVRALTSQAIARLRESLGTESMEVGDERTLP
jgi:RNA polymerase sigma factor (sigma-70 family)